MKDQYHPKKRLIKPLFLILAFSALINNSFGQLDLGISFTSGYVHHLKTVDDDAERYDFNIEEPMFGFETGLVVRKGLNKNLALESGIRYSRLGIKFDLDLEVDGELVSDYIVHRFDFVSVPLVIQWNPLPDKQFSPIIKLGVQNYFFLEEYVKFSGNLLLNEEDRKAAREWRKNNAFANRLYNPGLSFGAGIQRKLGGGFNVSILPTFNYQLLNAVRNRTSIRRNIYLAGVEFMVNYRLNKKKA